MRPSALQCPSPCGQPTSGIGGCGASSAAGRRPIAAAHYLRRIAHRAARRKSVYRGSVLVVPPTDGEPLQAAPRGWVDLRPDQFGSWIVRAAEMVRQGDARAAGPQESGSDVDWNAIDPDEPVEPARFATWVFTVEDKGTRIKR
jgi:hypothetical protein